MSVTSKLRAIDLYSGMGGWSLGLRLAGIEVVASYERNGSANETNFKNNSHQAQTVDIRRLSLKDLPHNIDVVVGSPPCTHFSFSNKGGGGDLDEGLQDVAKFLSIVACLKPKFWAMENVPRMADVIKEEIEVGGKLRKFKKLGLDPIIVNMEEFGLPQRRRRCILGNFDHDLLNSYSKKMPALTLGDVLLSLSKEVVVDPIYGISLPKSMLRDHVAETQLSEEEKRINEANKMLHPVYNSMPFPDSLERSARTITATCTRVSRESIVVADLNDPSRFRRLTIREKSCLQGFPISFQFYGSGYSDKTVMVGNALPPTLAYLIGHAFKGTSPERLPRLIDQSAKLSAPTPQAKDSIPHTPSHKFSPNRKFRFAIPSLRLKSGVRFELVNSISHRFPSWGVAFYFGTSSSIQSLKLDGKLHSLLISTCPASLLSSLEVSSSRLENFLAQTDLDNMQNIWSHRGPGKTRPFMLLDELDEVGQDYVSVLNEFGDLAQNMVKAAVAAEYGAKAKSLPGLLKLSRNAATTVAGMLVGSLTNHHVASRSILHRKVILSV